MTRQVGGAFASVVEANELPRIVRLEDNLYAAVFTLMKLLPARYIVDRARRSGALAPGATVIETSSGTFGLGLALVCRLRGHPLIVVGDPAIDRNLRTRLEFLGARVELVDAFDAPGGIQGARLARVAELHRAHPGSYVPDQYENPDNPGAYGIVADQLLSTLGPIGRLVGPVGSGGSTGGLAAALRQSGGDTKLTGVDTPGSVIFGHHNGKRLLRGLGSSIHAGNVRHTAYDDVHWVGAAPAFWTTRELYAERAIFAGPTSGASFLAARWHARQEPGSVTVALFPDDGYRYLDTVYNDDWLRAQGVDRIPPPAEPKPVTAPDDLDEHWSHLAWGRRPLTEARRFPS
ncbi:PLP-dependent cysteine synthase family protein [Amycolatopsis sp. lyj-23]|uniref:PLP-dependent cysteine synthase family protein n=1 Tax=Amycolatopsis sp. lyj-23 TaxID=2789283 RepID=UPI003979E007